MEELKFLEERQEDYDIKNYINDIFSVSRLFGKYEAIVSKSQFTKYLIPLLHKREAISSMAIEGTQTTLNEVFDNEVEDAEKRNNSEYTEVYNHTRAIVYGFDYLRVHEFSHEFIKNIHKLMMDGLDQKDSGKEIGEYKTQDNHIVNSLGKIVFDPPSYKKTNKYMTELIDYMNKKDDTNPFIKVAIIHAQFESIHPFENGNGRVGRMLINMYLFKQGVINVPIFYISEALNVEKSVYYKKLTSTRESSYDEWISFFLKKCIQQVEKHINYFEQMDALYTITKEKLRLILNSPKFEEIVKCLFTSPILTSKYFANKLKVSQSQARKYLINMEKNKILLGDDRERNRKYIFDDLINII